LLQVMSLMQLLLLLLEEQVFLVVKEVYEGSIVGTVIGALVLTVIRNGLTILGVSTFFQQVIMGIIIVVVVAIDMWRRGE